MTGILLLGSPAFAQTHSEPHEGMVLETPASGASAASSEPLRILSFFERNYFATAFDSDNAVKFQLSVKLNLWPTARDPRSFFDGPRHGVYAAYTQRAIWDIYDIGDSSAIVSMDFQPEIFYRFGYSGPRESGCRFWLAQLGLQHISNGERGQRSRSVNWAKGRVEAGCSIRGTSPNFSPYVSSQIDVWSPPVFPVENPDIADYLGLFEFSLTAATNVLDGQSVRSENARWYGIFELVASVRPGFSKGRVSFQGEGHWKPGYPDGWRLTPYLYVQYFNGYGETLLTYDERSRQFRIGLGFHDILVQECSAPRDSVQSATPV